MADTNRLLWKEKKKTKTDMCKCSQFITIAGLFLAVIRNKDLKSNICGSVFSFIYN